MFVFFSKLLPALIYPVGLVFLLIVAAIFFQKRRRIQKAILIAAAVVLFLGGNQWVAGAVVRSLERQVLAPDPLPTADMIIVLGGGTDPQQTPRPMVEMNSSGDRVAYAAHLYRMGMAPVVLASGGAIDWMGERGSSPAEESADLLQQFGVPTEKIILQDRSLNTYEEAVLDAEIVRQQGARQVLLVTSAMHMPRAAGLFAKQGVKVIPAPVDYKVTEQGWKDLMHPTLENFLIGLIPSANESGLLVAALKEYLGMFVYTLRGWL